MRLHSRRVGDISTVLDLMVFDEDPSQQVYDLANIISH